ncbi:LON peptidase substrate-binding domain-containing protein [Ramlibacter sp. PS4R-6]|uniref:LON peptidase substrate-binding domain-containing protein n=1 Tax=Ramlibacter sp. PS4R-6 TaxID=3133438 RepID=UPI0030A83880
MSSALTLQSLPLFPLSTVLFPGGVLPLKIFEVRYLDMIGKVHKAGAPLGVVSLIEGAEVQQPGQKETFRDVGTLATLEHVEQVQPGLMHIRARGGQRFRILRRERLRHGLWVADVQMVAQDAHVEVPDDLRGVATALDRLLHSLRDQGVAEGELPVQAPLALQDSGWLANRWCELMPMPVELKQRLMELDNPLVRLELVGDLLANAGIDTRTA